MILDFLNMIVGEDGTVILNTLRLTIISNIVYTLNIDGRVLLMIFRMQKVLIFLF